MTPKPSCPLRLRPSWWLRAQKVATPVALIAWLVILVGSYPIYLNWKDARAGEELRAAGVTIHGEKGAYKIRIDDATKADAISRIFANVEYFDPISLDIGNDQLTSLPSLDRLTGLTSLTISHNRYRRLDEKTSFYNDLYGCGCRQQSCWI